MVYQYLSTADYSDIYGDAYFSRRRCVNVSLSLDAFLTLWYLASFLSQNAET